MTERLQQAVAHVAEQAKDLPEDLQNSLADRLDTLAQEIAERRWNALLADPRSDAFLESLIAEAQAELHAGQTVELDEFLTEEAKREGDEA